MRSNDFERNDDASRLQASVTQLLQCSCRYRCIAPVIVETLEKLVLVILEDFCSTRPTSSNRMSWKDFERERQDEDL